LKKISVYIILVIILIIFISRSDYDFKVILNASAQDLTFLGAVILLSYFSTFLSIAIQLRLLDVKEERKNICMLSLATNLLNYLPAKGGMISFGTFLKVKKKVPVNKFVFSTMLIYILVTIFTLLLSLFFIFDERMIRLYVKINLSYILMLFALLLIALIISINLARKKKDNALSKYYLLFLSNKDMIFRNKLNMFYLFVLIFTGIVLFSMRMYFAFRIAGSEITLYDSLLIGVIANLSFFFSFTPGGLGVKEGFVGGISFILFGNAGIGVVASLADRGVNLILTLITGTIAVRHLDRKYFSNNKENE